MVMGNRERKCAMNHAVKKCDICCNAFVSNSNSQKYCSECKNVYRKIIREKKKPKKVKSLTEFQKEAQEHGMSYGKYMAYLQKGEQSE